MLEKLISRNNITIHGDGNKSMLFVHGYGCDQNMWRFITPQFKKDYKIILIDLVGSGKSDENAYDFDKYSSLDGYADDIVEICDALDLKNLTFVGHSVSAMIGVLANLKRPAIFEKLIMIGPSPRYINDNNYYGGFSQNDIDELIATLESNYLGWSSAMAPAIMGNDEKPELAEELEQSFCQTNPEIAKHFAKVTFLGDNRSDLDKLTTDTLILQCNSDVIASIEVGQYVHKHVSNSKFVLLDATGHCPHLSAPNQTIEAMKSYLI
ncbi:alpha/beta fold hydrolase [Polaribacter sp. SA4-12]|uniref:alpha/beta fold hydrolase n=1 Tax=Polaribacter sp. SA4-12 TaxID=1312072 RepID=UPI000B3C50D1|nr:alpha/beta hydrolase [Polaribacter sp. SA4-12]ARV14132.1 alpha/beta hydrolase [Polaribacter sp. SA4-12]